MPPKRIPLTGLLLLGMLAVLSACGQASAKLGPTPPATPAPPKGWNAVASPRVNEEGSLKDVTAISANNAWAVGSYYGIDALQRTLTEHWDGVTWSVVASPNPSSVANELDAISGSSASDIWAVGQVNASNAPQFTTTPLIEHWNGTSWVVSPVPALGQGEHLLSGVAVDSPTDAWAVGTTKLSGANGQTTTPLIIRWDGSAWKTVASPVIAGDTLYSLNAVTAISLNDAWAVGDDYGKGENSLIEHWDGSAWTVAQDNSVMANGANAGGLTSVSADAPNDVWAAGSGLSPSMGGCGNGTSAVMEHWDGQNWSYVTYPAPPISNGQGVFAFNHIAAHASNDVWAVGGVSTNSRVTTPLVEHWDGSQWSVTLLSSVATANGFAGVAAKAGVTLAVGQAAISNGFGATVVEQWTGAQWARVASPSPGTLTNELKGISVIGAKDIWAVGDSAAGTLSEHWDGAQWSVIPTANATTQDNYLRAVAGATPNDVWAVGYTDRCYGDQGLVEHWDGSSWTVVPAFTASLFGVAALSGTDAWAVGQSGAIHWNGSVWAASAGAPASLLGVTAVSANDVWAVGGNLPQSCGGPTPAIIAHWNGKQWSSMPNMPEGVLETVSAASANDIWAVGPQLIMHWDGKQWTQVTLPDALRKQVVFAHGVCAHSSDDVWIVGGQSDAQHFSVLHWDGHAWSSIALKPLGQADDTLDAVAAAPAGEVWAVGSYSQYFTKQALIERYVA